MVPLVLFGRGSLFFTGTQDDPFFYCRYFSLATMNKIFINLQMSNFASTLSPNMKNKYNKLNSTQQNRFRNFRSRFPSKYQISNQEIYNQLVREIEHNYTSNEKGNVHHFMKTQNKSAKQAHNKILRHRESRKTFVPIPDFGKHYAMNR